MTSPRRRTSRDVRLSTERFEAAISESIEAIRLCVSNRLEIAALMLSYALIDNLAWCERRNIDGNVVRSDFIRWCERYGMRSRDGMPSAEDFYSARCALLHGRGAESRMTQERAARPLWYEIRDQGISLAPATISLGVRSRTSAQASGDSRHRLEAPLAPLIIDITAFVDILAESCDRMTQDLRQHRNRRARALRQAAFWIQRRGHR
jgi:hypothetical protein